MDGDTEEDFDVRAQVAGRCLRPNGRLHLVPVILIRFVVLVGLEVLDEHPLGTQDVDEFGEVDLCVGQASHQLVEDRLREVAPAHHLTLELVDRIHGGRRPVDGGPRRHIGHDVLPH